MSETTKIAWTDSTFNPWTMCTPVSPGCDNCYASAWAKRTGRGEYRQGVPRVRTSKANWAEPLKWNRKAEASGERWLVFCASLADVFDNEVDPSWRWDLFELIRRTPNLTWLLLTKRISNVAKMIVLGDVGQGGKRLPDNVWLGASVVNQEEADRDIPKLLATPAAKRFVSYEPALGPVEWLLKSTTLVTGTLTRTADLLDWIIVGGESGPKARPFDLAWARSTVEQCTAAGVPVFVKQLGARPVVRDGHRLPSGVGCGWNHEIKAWDWPFGTGAHADPAEWPEDLRVQEFPA